jgi:peptidoglycan/LPS O-acetylase OafA/YrhL
MRSRHRPLDSLSAHAYNIYLIHYVPVVWLQYVLLGGSLDALEKGATVFVLALALSWALSAGLAVLLSRAYDMVGRRVMTNQPQ